MALLWNKIYAAVFYSTDFILKYLYIFNNNTLKWVYKYLGYFD